MKNLKNLMELRKSIQNKNNLIHCITNPISINSAANLILSTGCSPIMAEHPDEVENITKRSKSLLLNLGNITDARIISIQKSSKVAKELNIPVVLDLVGITVSDIRMKLAKELLQKKYISVLKGNMSEIKAIGELHFESQGVDVSEKDKVNSENLDENIEIVKEISKKYGCVVVSTGKYDIVSNGNDSIVIKNGVEMLSRITGTGCMLGALIASYISEIELFDGSILACAVFGICGELSTDNKGNMTFYNELMDNLFLIDDRKIKELIKVDYYE